MPASKVFLGREDEVCAIRRLVADVCAGHGRSALVEGEPGIGKSSLLRVGLATASRCGVRVRWGAADELSQRWPLRPLLNCFDAAERAEVIGPPRHAETALLDAPGDPLLAPTERLLTLVDRACAAGPVALVLDDLQWADDASLMVWNQLARVVDQLPLLLVGAARPVPRRPAIAELRRSLRATGAEVIVLDPLPGPRTTELVGALVGAALGPAPSGLRSEATREDGATGGPGARASVASANITVGPRLAKLAEQAGGNPLYLRELVDALLREDRIRIEATAELTEERGAIRVPASLTAAINDRLSFLAAPATRTLRVAALLGTDFSVVDLAAVTGEAPTALMASLEEGVAAGVILDTGARLAFRHPLIRQVLYEGTPQSVRTALHRQAARALATDGSAVDRVAEQLLAAVPEAVDEWMLDWLCAAVSGLASRNPQVAVTLVKLALDVLADSDPRRELLEASLATVQRLLNRFDEAEQLARQVRERTVDPGRAAHMAWIQGYCLLGTARAPEALDVLAAALRDNSTPRRWYARLRALRAVVLGSSGRYDEALATADRARRDGRAAGDGYAVAMALHAKAQTVARDDTRAGLDLVDQGLAVAPGGADGVDLRLLLLTNRLNHLTILDRPAEAASTVREALVLAEGAGTARHAALRVSAAQAHFAGGRWDDALAELEPAEVLHDELANNRPKLIIFHGLAALIAAHRDDRSSAAEHLGAVQHIAITKGVRQRSADYLMLARAAVDERNGQRTRAIAALAPALDVECAKDVTSRHPILPDLVRLALAEADLDTVRAATATCLTETANSGLPGRTAAANHCRGLAAGDEGLLRAAAAYYRTAGRPWELGQTMEDLAELLGRADRTTAARAAFGEAVDAYTTLGATWDILRAEMRVRAFGIRRGQRGPRRRPAHGWAALTPTEITVARMVADGLSNPDIAASLLLSRRTVQTHISHILAKLRVRSRVDIAREVFEHGDSSARRDRPGGRSSGSARADGRSR